MMDIGVGDWIECVDDSHTGASHVHLTVGALYRVLAVGLSLCDWVTPCAFVMPPRSTILICGVAHYYSGHGLFRFRPIYRPRESLIEALKAPPKRVKEVA